MRRTTATRRSSARRSTSPGSSASGRRGRRRDPGGVGRAARAGLHPRSGLPDRQARSSRGARGAARRPCRAQAPQAPARRSSFLATPRLIGGLRPRPPRTIERLMAAAFPLTFEDTAAPACDSCGRTPARPVRVRRHVGLLVLQRFVSVRVTACRPCGHALIRSYAGKTLWQGWWGRSASPSTGSSSRRT